MRRFPLHGLLQGLPALLVGFLIGLAGLAAPALADTPRTTETTAAESTAAEGTITLERIMDDPDWIGALPENPRWSADGETIYFQRDPADRKDDDERLWRLDPASGEAEEIPAAELGTADPVDGDWSDDRRAKVYAFHGDIFWKNADWKSAEDGEVRQLTRTAATESAPFFLAGDQRVAFERDGQWLVHDLRTGLLSQPAEVLAADDPAEEDPASDDPGDDYLVRQQERLFEVIRDQQADEERRREREMERRRASGAFVPPPFYLGEEREIVASALSPTAEALVVITRPASADEGKKSRMPNYVGADGYVEIRDVRPKVGVGGDYTHSAFLLDLPSHEIHELDLGVLPGITDDPLAAVKAENEAAREDDDGTTEAEEAASGGDNNEDQKSQEEKDAEPRDVRILGVRWSPDGAHAALQIYSRDNKDRWLALVSPRTMEDDAGDGEEDDGPELRPAHRLHLEGWINWDHNEFGWLPDGRLWLLSEETGYSHLFLHDPASGATRQLTRGDFVVSAPEPSPEGEWIYVVANPSHPGTYDVFRVATRDDRGDDTGDDTGGEATWEQVSHLGGLTTFELSPAGDRLLLRHSSLRVPPELFLQPAEPTENTMAEATRLTESRTPEFRTFDWVEPEIVPVPSTHHERPVWARYYPPRNPDRLRGPDGRIPAVLFVHGAGYLQNVHRGWSSYFREFMFHSLLSEHGYAVLDMDYRGSKGYGEAWRTAIYRHMGEPELRDLLDGISWLSAEHGVDEERVGIYGGSYGGFMALMALFKEPGAFAAGAALRPVTDWAHYNHSYTSNILNTPELDPIAYERSSPIEFAAGLEDPLLVAAPMLDDNVHFQDVVRLAQKLIELEKDDWEVAIFPVEPHGFRRASSWLDEYRRIFEHFEAHVAPVEESP